MSAQAKTGKTSSGSKPNATPSKGKASKSVAKDVITAFLDDVAGHPERFIVTDKSVGTEILPAMAHLYQAAKVAEPKELRSPLDQLVTSGFDAEQIWEELQLQNESHMRYFNDIYAKLAKHGTIYLSDTVMESEEESNENEPSSFMDQDLSEELSNDESDTPPSKNAKNAKSASSDTESDDSDDDEDEDEVLQPPVKRAKKAEVVKGTKKRRNNEDSDENDEVEEFVKMQDEKELEKRSKTKGKKDESEDDEEDDDDEDDEIDFFGDIGSDEDGEEEEDEKNRARGNLFDGDDEDGDDDEANGEQSDDKDDDDELDEHEDDESEHSFEEDDGSNDDDENGADEQSAPSKLITSDDEEENDDEFAGLSRFEREQRRLQAQIKQLEDFNVSDKPWQLIGEADAATRPMNSLLQEDVTFDVVTRPAPEITIETTQTLEELIKTRIRDQAWDDVEPKSADDVLPFKPRIQIEMNQEKSKESLAEIYEKDYLKHMTGSAATAAQDALHAKHSEISELMALLDSRLNALTNFHYVPTAPKESLNVVTNVSSLRVEEITPAATSDAARMAPEEVHKKSKGEIIGDSEKTKTDKLRERRHKKALKRTEAKEKEKAQKLIDRLKPGLGNKHSKQNAMKRIQADVKKGAASNVKIMDTSGASANRFSSTKFFSELQNKKNAAPAAPAVDKSRKTDAQLRL